MARLLSASSAQPLYTIASYVTMIALSGFVVHFLLLAINPLPLSAAQKGSYHDDAGVLKWVNPKIGTYGVTPNGNGGMIPSVGMPFGMTRWTPQTREVSPPHFPSPPPKTT